MGIRAASTFNQSLTGNKIGRASRWSDAGTQRSHGIFIHSGSGNNRIGGPLDSDVNIIANKAVMASDRLGSCGWVWRFAGVGNSVIRNLIFGNAGQAIDLGPNDGPTANDLDDVDVAPTVDRMHR